MMSDVFTYCLVNAKKKSFHIRHQKKMCDNSESLVLEDLPVLFAQCLKIIEKCLISFSCQKIGKNLFFYNVEFLLEKSNINVARFDRNVVK